MPFSSVGPSDIFSCKKCGHCCKGFGGTYVTEKDIHAIAAYIGVDEKEFTEKYCQMSGSRWVIAAKEDGYCVFWDEICTIHLVKPKMCRAWPFIASVLIDVENWHIMAGSCAGIHTDLPDSVILDCVRKEIQTRKEGGG